MELDLRYRTQELKTDNTIQSIVGFPLLVMHILFILSFVFKILNIESTFFESGYLGTFILIAQALLFLVQYISTIYWMVLKSEQHKVYFVVATMFLLLFLIGLGVFSIIASAFFIYAYWYWTYTNYHVITKAIEKDENVLDDLDFRS